MHPGYGFLSEQADFAEACAAAGITFIGPSPETLRLVGDKVAAREHRRARRRAYRAGLAGPRRLPKRRWRRPAASAYPLLIKAAAGGGGKGIRRVDRQ